MRKLNSIFCFICINCLINPTLSYADNQNVVDQRTQQEEAIANNPFLISFYQPSYILPYYYTLVPDQAVYKNNTPEDESINPYEVKFQFSFKVPVWQHILGSVSTLYAAYTQLSYWQAYNKSAFFRESDYEPEIFFANQINWPIYYGWRMNFLNVGVAHQSNGQGGTLERSWNRIYLESILAKGNWSVSIKPWYIIHDATMNADNPDIGKYLGYERAVLAYKYNKQVFSLEARNTVESGFRRSALELGWSFPLTKHLNGYVQIFSGYGQSLIEYNHYANSVGLGIALSNWV